MNFQVGDLIIAKDERNRRYSTYVVAVHETGHDNDGVHYWTSSSITIQYSQDHWVRLPISTIKAHLNEPFKPARWYHFPVK